MPDRGSGPPVDERLRQGGASGVDGRFSVVTVVRDEEDAHPLTPVLARKRITRRDRLKAEKNVEIVRRARLEFAIPAHHLCGIRQIENDRPAVEHLCRVAAKQEAGHDSEIPAAATQCP